MNKSPDGAEATKKQTSLGGHDELHSRFVCWFIGQHGTLNRKSSMKKSLGMLVLMTVMIVAVANMLALAAPASSANAQQVNGPFLTMLNETGCTSKYSDDKKAFLYQQNWRGREMIVIGEISNAEKGDVYVKVLSSTLTFDVIVTLNNPQATFDLEKGQRVTVKFQISAHGGCFLAFRGTNGVLLQQQAGR
jgi:hypothetical protein